MYVYVITRYVEFEGETVLGVAKTPGSAKKFAATKFNPGGRDLNNAQNKEPRWRGNYKTGCRADEPSGSELFIDRTEVIE